MTFVTTKVVILSLELPNTTKKKEKNAMIICLPPTWMSTKAIMVLYRTTVTPSLRSDSPNTMK